MDGFYNWSLQSARGDDGNGKPVPMFTTLGDDKGTGIFRFTAYFAHGKLAELISIVSIRSRIYHHGIKLWNVVSNGNFEWFSHFILL